MPGCEPLCQRHVQGILKAQRIDSLFYLGESEEMMLESSFGMHSFSKSIEHLVDAKGLVMHEGK